MGQQKKGKTGLKCGFAFWHFGLQRKENCTTISILLVARKQLPWSLLYSPSFQISFSNFIKPIHQRKRWKANERIWTKTTIWDVPSVSDRIKSFGRGKVLNSCYSSHWRLRWKIFQMGKKNSQGRGGKKKGGGQRQFALGPKQSKARWKSLVAHDDNKQLRTRGPWCETYWV